MGMNKIIGFLTMAVMLSTMTANAGVRVYSNSSVNLGVYESINCGVGVSCAKASVGKLNMNVGVASRSVFAASASLTAAQCGTHFINVGGATVATLPEASTVLGCVYVFICGDGNDFDINPADGTDQIGPVSTTNGTTAVVTLAPAAGDAIRCTDKGGSITLEATGNDYWSQIGGGNGVFTDVN